MADIAVTFLIAVLAGLGVGSGGLLVIYLTLACGVPQLRAQGINLAFFIVSAAASVALQLRRAKPDAAVLSVLAVFGIAGALLGSRAAGFADPGLLRRAFGGILALSGAYTLIRSVPPRHMQTRRKTPLQR